MIIVMNIYVLMKLHQLQHLQKVEVININTVIENAKDINVVIPMFNLIKNSYNYS